MARRYNRTTTKVNPRSKLYIIEQNFEEIMQRYRLGVPVSAMCAEYGISACCMREHLKSLGAEIRGNNSVSKFARKSARKFNIIETHKNNLICKKWVNV